VLHHGEAIYGTHPWKKYGEGRVLNNRPNRYTAEDIRFTVKGDALYAIFLAWLMYKDANDDRLIGAMINWSQIAMFSPTSFTFNLTPPADEREDITFMRDGFPTKSHR
jgi:hypothetical protein